MTDDKKETIFDHMSPKTALIVDRELSRPRTVVTVEDPVEFQAFGPVDVEAMHKALEEAKNNPKATGSAFDDTPMGQWRRDMAKHMYKGTTNPHMFRLAQEMLTA